MKRQVFFAAICLLLSHTGFTQGSTLYLEFYGNGMLHRGVLMVDAQGRGQCRIAFQSQQGIVTVDQQVQQMAAQQSGYYYPSQPQQQDIVFACASPTLANIGQYAQGYAPDNFYLLANGQMVNCDANGGRCPVNYRPIQSQQELQAILQSLGGNATPSYPSTPSCPTGGRTYPQPQQPAPPNYPTPSTTPQPVPTPPTSSTKPKGPKYPTKPGGLGN